MCLEPYRDHTPTRPKTSTPPHLSSHTILPPSSCTTPSPSLAFLPSLAARRLIPSPAAARGCPWPSEPSWSRCATPARRTARPEMAAVGPGRIGPGRWPSLYGKITQLLKCRSSKKIPSLNIPILGIFQGRTGSVFLKRSHLGRIAAATARLPIAAHGRSYEGPVVLQLRRGVAQREAILAQGRAQGCGSRSRVWGAWAKPCLQES